MASIKEIKSHIKSISDTQKITNAMYLVSSSKLKIGKSELEKLIPYSDIIEDEYNIISGCSVNTDHPLMNSKGDNKAVLVIGSDKDLAGEYIKNIVKYTVDYCKREDCELYIIGNKVKNKLAIQKVNYIRDFDFPFTSRSYEYANEILNYFTEKFINGEISSLTVIYTKQINNIKIKVTEKEILPLKFGDNSNKQEIEFFPDIKTVTEAFIPLYLSNTMLRIITESYCCEQNARMLAMEAANSSASEILEDLKIQYNHTRQNAITQEITEISGERKQQ